MRGPRIDPTRYTDPGLLGTIVQQVRLAWRLINDPRVPGALKALIPALAVLYVVSPVDLIPDFFLGVGQLDDIGILLAALMLFVKLAPAAVVAEHRASMNGDRGPVADAPAGDERAFEAEYRVGNQRGDRQARR